MQRSSSYHGFAALPEVASDSNGRGEVSESPFEKELKDAIFSFRQYLGITTSGNVAIASLDEVPIYDSFFIVLVRISASSGKFS